MGLDKNGDLLDTINEYSVHFKDAGYSAEEMFNSLKNGEDFTLHHFLLLNINIYKGFIS